MELGNPSVFSFHFFGCVSMVPNNLPETNISIGGWKMKLPLGIDLFSGAMLLSGRVYPNMFFFSR